MERTFLGFFTTGLLGLSAFGCLATVWGTGEKGAIPAGNGWRLLEPITYENLTIFPVVTSHEADTTAFLTLDEGLSSGEVLVQEQGADTMRRSRDARPIQDYSGGASVNRLVLINRSKRPLVLLAGELVSGGKQDRVIGKDRIVAPGADPLPLDVFCVEHGRWSSGAAFSAAKTIVHPSVREKAAVDQAQGRVWEAVRSGSTYSAGAAGSGAGRAPAPRLSADALTAVIANEAGTESYDKIYSSRAVGVPMQSFVEEVQKRFARATSSLKGERVIGVVVAYSGEVAWSDLFASGELFNGYWSKLLRSYVVEALARPQLREHPSMDDAREFLRPLNGIERAESEPGVYRWREITEGRLAQIELDALRPKELTLHHLKIHRTS